jgi:DNA-binding CsgD family transcriptional regulator
MVRWEIHWDVVEGYPFGPLDGSLADVTIGGNLERLSDRDRATVLGWTAFELRGCWPVSEIRQRYFRTTRLSLLESEIASHPSFAGLQASEPKHGHVCCSVMHLARTCVSIAVRMCGRTERPSGEELVEGIARLIGMKGYFPAKESILEVLTRCGLADQWIMDDGDIPCVTFANLQAVADLARHAELEGHIDMCWSPFPRVAASMELTVPTRLKTDRASVALNYLSDREAAILRSVYDDRKLEAIGDKHGISKERVRQLRDRALRKLTTPTTRCSLAEILCGELCLLPSPRVVPVGDLRRIVSRTVGWPVRDDKIGTILEGLFDLVVVDAHGPDLCLVTPLGRTPELPDLARWEDDVDINSQEYAREAFRACEGGLTSAEFTFLRDQARRVHRQPTAFRICVVRALKAVGAPAHFKVITLKARELFPDHHKLTHNAVDGLLKRLPTTHVVKVKRAVYAHPEFAHLAPIYPEETGGATTPIVPSRPGAVGRLDGLEAGRSTAAIDALVRKLVSRAKTIPLPRSICEMKLDQAEFEELSRWFREADHELIRLYINGYNQYVGVDDDTEVTQTCGIGFAFLVLFSEQARRSEGHGVLWPTVRDGLAQNLQRTLFRGNGLTEAMQEALETALRRLGMRHVLGQEGAQSLYLSINLQFGLSKPSLKRLPVWLRGLAAAPRAVELLTDSALRCQ